MGEYGSIDIELGEFSRQTNNLPANNTNKLRNRLQRWRTWRRNHPYEEILDPEANRQVNREEWTQETYQENPPMEEGFEEVELENLAPETEITEDIAETAIDIGEIGETTGLLEGAGLGAATLGGSATTSALGSGVGTAVGTLALGGGAAVLGGTVGKVLESGWSGKGYVLPGSEYIGPGNPIQIGPARNPADQVAREHDLGYQDLLNKPPEDFHKAVQDLDNKAISDFDKVYEETGDVNAKIGSIGLGIKRKVVR